MEQTRELDHTCRQDSQFLHMQCANTLVYLHGRSNFNLGRWILLQLILCYVGPSDAKMSLRVNPIFFSRKLCFKYCILFKYITVEIQQNLDFKNVHPTACFSIWWPISCRAHCLVYCIVYRQTDEIVLLENVSTPYKFVEIRIKRCFCESLGS